MQTEPDAASSPVVHAVHRLLLRARGPRLRRAVELLYLGAARAAAAFLTRGEPGASAYLRGRLGGPDFVPGLADVDLALVLADAAGAGRTRLRWLRLKRAVPPTELLIDWPRVYDEAELRDLAGASSYTYGLEGPPARSGFVRGPAAMDATRTLDRPGLHGTTADWRLLSGPERRPTEPARDAQDRRSAAWLELLYWWRLIVPFCLDPSRPRTADLSVKLVAESARVWLWLTHGERPASREDALRLLARLLPDEAPAARRALDVRRRLPERPDPALDELLPAAVRLSARVAALIGEEVAEAGVTEVRLAGTEAPLPLADWRGIVCPEPLESFALADGEPGDPAAVAAAATAEGPRRALRSGDLLVLPALGIRPTRLRAIECRAVDPVPFALLDGEAVARFPEVRGWSARDTARRAVAEHREWLRLGETDRGTLLSAARAALFLESVEAGAPELCLTAAELERRLGGAAPLRDLVLGLYEARDPRDD